MSRKYVLELSDDAAIAFSRWLAINFENEGPLGPYWDYAGLALLDDPLDEEG